MFAIPAVLGAQTEVPPAASWLETHVPRCGEVVGRVVGRASVFDTADTRLVPLVGAFVAVVDSSAADLARRQRARAAAPTDTAGEFRLRLPPGRTSVLEVKAVGYARALVAVDGARERAVVLMLALGSGATDVPHRGIHVLTSRGATACAP
jgi:hypothetical protein